MSRLKLVSPIYKQLSTAQDPIAGLALVSLGLHPFTTTFVFI